MGVGGGIHKGAFETMRPVFQQVISETNDAVFAKSLDPRKDVVVSFMVGFFYIPSPF